MKLYHIKIRTAVAVAATGVGIKNETFHLDIGAYILEFHADQLTKDSEEINYIHELKYNV